MLPGVLILYRKKGSPGAPPRTPVSLCGTNLEEKEVVPLSFDKGDVVW